MHHARPRRFLGALTTLAALAAAGLATLPAEAAVPPTRTVEVAYGDGPVTQTSWDEPIALVFEGRKGDQVSVVSSLRPDGCDTGEDIVLTGPGGEVAQPASLFYRLPASGRFTFSYRQDCWDEVNSEEGSLRHSSALQLVKLRMKDVAAGERVKIPFQQGYVAAVRITLQSHERPLEIPAREWDDLITPYAERTTTFGAGSPIQDWYNGYGSPIVLRKGLRVPGFHVPHSRVRYHKPFIFYRIDAGITLKLRHLHR